MAWIRIWSINMAGRHAGKTRQYAYSSSPSPTRGGSPALLLRRFKLFERVGSIIHLVKHGAADQNRRLLLDGHGNAIARPRIQFDDFLLMQFVFRRDNEPRVKRAVFHIIDHRSVDLSAESSQHVGHEVVGQRTLFVRAREEHVDRVAHGGIDINNEGFPLRAEKQCRAISGRDDGLELDGNDLLVRHPAQITPGPPPNPEAKFLSTPADCALAPRLGSRQDKSRWSP